MKKNIILAILCIAISSCGQKKNEKKDIMDQNNVLKVTEIYKNVKKYVDNPSYTLHINSTAGCTFELLVNDLPVYEFYDSGNCTGSIPINENLVKSGIQKLKIRITPPVNENFDMAKEIDLAKIVFKININYGDYGKVKVKDFKNALNYEFKNSDQKLPYYEINLDFNAEVPYQNDINAWVKSVDLSKEDESKLLKEVEDYYKDMIKIYERKDINSLAGVFYLQQKEFAQSYYTDNKQDLEKVVAQWNSYLEDTRPFVFDQYRLKFFGDNKMVALVKTDKFYFNESALMREDADGNYQSYSLFLHRPKQGAKLEVIR